MTNTTPRLLSEKIADNIYSKEHYPNESGHEEGIRAVSEQAFKEGCEAQQSLTAAEYQEQIDALAQEITNLRDDLEKRDKEIEELKEEVSRLQRSYDTAQSFIDDGIAKLQSSHQAKIKELFQEIELVSEIVTQSVLDPRVREIKEEVYKSLKSKYLQGK